MLKLTVTICVVAVLVAQICASPVMYKKSGDKDTYEADLVPVSSTVIPLAEYQVMAGIHGKPNENYKKMYMKHLHKKVEPIEEDPDTLITLKKKYHEKKQDKQAKVKSV